MAAVVKYPRDPGQRGSYHVLRAEFADWSRGETAIEALARRPGAGSRWLQRTVLAPRSDVPALAPVLEGPVANEYAIRSRWQYDAVPAWRRVPATLVCEVAYTTRGAGSVSRRGSYAGGPTDWRTIAAWINSNGPKDRLGATAGVQTARDVPVALVGDPPGELHVSYAWDCYASYSASTRGTQRRRAPMNTVIIQNSSRPPSSSARNTRQISASHGPWLARLRSVQQQLDVNC
jgi:hypothetical protein